MSKNNWTLNIVVLSKELLPVITATYITGEITIIVHRNYSFNRILIFPEELKISSSTIKSQIFSPLGIPPIYGETSLYASGYPSGDFYIHDLRNIHDPKIIGGYNLPNGELFLILEKLFLVSPFMEICDFSNYTDVQISNRLQVLAIPTNNLSVARQKFYLTLISQSYTRAELLRLLKETLIKIGHYVNRYYDDI